MAAARKERCESCRFFGPVVDERRVPSGQCQRNAPGKYTVLQVIVTPWGGFTLRTEDTLESPFPAVWPYDGCGEWRKADDVTIRPEASASGD